MIVLDKKKNQTHITMVAINCLNDITVVRTSNIFPKERQSVIRLS